MTPVVTALCWTIFAHGREREFHLGEEVSEFGTMSGISLLG